MAFTTVSRIILDQGNGDPNGYFYPEDIAIVLNQLSATGVPAKSVITRKAVNPAGTKEFNILVAVTEVTYLPNGSPSAPSELLLEPHHWVAISCPPYAHTGGFFEANP